MTEKEFREALAKASGFKEKMFIITQQFNATGLITPRENVVATYYIAEALHTILE